MTTANTDIWRALPAMAENIPVAQVPAMLALLASAQAALAARLATAPPDIPNRLGHAFMNIAELAVHLGVGESTLRRMIDDGDFKAGDHYVRVNRRILLDPVAVEAHLRETSTREVNRRADGAIPFMRKERRRGQST